MHFARWLTMLARWLLPNMAKSKMAAPMVKPMWHGCKHSSSWDHAGTGCCTEQDCIFNVLQSAQMDICHVCTFQIQMLQYPDTLYTLGHCEIHQGVCNISIPCCMYVNFCAVLCKDTETVTHQCAEAVIPHTGIR